MEVHWNPLSQNQHFPKHRKSRDVTNDISKIFFLNLTEVQPFSPTSSSTANNNNANAATSSVADSNSSNSSSCVKTFVACKVCGDKASGKYFFLTIFPSSAGADFFLFCFHAIRIPLRRHLMRRLQGELKLMLSRREFVCICGECDYCDANICARQTARKIENWFLRSLSTFSSYALCGVLCVIFSRFRDFSGEAYRSKSNIAVCATENA